MAEASAKAFAVAIDLETTGLDAGLEVPLELGLKIIDASGNVVDRKSWLIYEDNLEYHKALDGMIPFVKDMHLTNGLIDDIGEAAYLCTRSEVDLQAAAFVAVNTGDDLLPLLGNSIGSLDRPFVQTHLPELNAALSHRNIDISTIRELCKVWNPDLYANIVAELDAKFGHETKHRVMDDIDYCLALYRLYVENFFIISEDITFVKEA